MFSQDYSERDTAVIPWLPSYQHTSTLATPKQPCKIIQLLSARERIGLKSKCSRVGCLSEGVLVSNEELSRAGAWNRRRLQNMILAIGPGTPAACVLTSVPTGSSAAADGGEESESNDDDDIYHAADSDEEDDVEMLVDDEEMEEEEVVEELEEGELDLGSETGSGLEAAAGEAKDEEDLPMDGLEDEGSKTEHTSAKQDNPSVDESDAKVAARPATEEDTDNDIAEPEQYTSRRGAWTIRHDSIRDALMGEGNDHGNGSDNDSHHTHIDSGDDDDSEDRDINASRARQADRVLEFIENQILRQHRRQQRPRSSSGAARGHTQQSRQYEREVARSMKHGGCINTACWLDCGWRISTVSHEDAHPYDRFYNNAFITSSSYSSNDNFSTPTRQRPNYNDGLSVFTSPSEYPTQLITSGDDHLVKFWDVSESMGSTSPLPGGSSTITPFSSPMVSMRATSELISKWRSHVQNDDHDDDLSHRHRRHLPGIVHPLITLSTGHRGNVFHATPVPQTPGKVVTCAADGHLRLTDVEINATSSPAAQSRGRSNSVSSASNAGEASTIVISPEYENSESLSAFRFRDSLMCFSHHFLSPNTGLVCSERGLLHFDLRLPPSSQKRESLVEELKTTCKSCCVWTEHAPDSDSAYVFAGGTGTDVALYDLRMTGRPSSQAVQRYRPRPLRQKSSVSVSGIELSKDKQELLVAYESDQCYTFPVMPEINSSSDDSAKGAKPLPELAQYGGHLNRLTFLKMAKYAGPNDEYICTGSDSGHAWIYDKHTGAVAAFLRADHSTCNGILPHPSLPYFITYGIDSSVKLWRATMPVDDVDDSDLGRYRYWQQGKYTKSIVADKWKASRKRNPVDLDDEDLSFFPDETPSEDVFEDSISLGFMGLLFARSRSSSEIPFIGNDLSNLSVEIRRNYFTCARAGSDEDVPIKSGLLGLKRRMGLIKLIHQADQLGLRADSNVPWNLSFKGHLQMRVAKCDVYSYGAAHDLIPDPSDWVPFHPLMANPPHKCGMQFIKRSKQFYYETYFDKSIHPAKRALLLLNASDAESKNIEETPSNLDGDDKPRSTRAWDILYCTVLLLKEAGNLALQKSLNCLAARYYDKAIVYCSVAYLQFPVGNCSFLAQHQIVLSENSGCECRWTSLLKTLIQIRLNMALCCLKNDVNDPKAAISQAKLALKELKPFVAQKGCVLTGKKLERPRLEEPPTTYVEATALQSKAFFRLGSAQLLMGDFDAAIESFEQSIKSSNASSPDSKPDPIILRKLQEAKLTSRRHSNSERKKFKFAFSSKNDESKEAAEGKNTCNEH